MRLVFRLGFMFSFYYIGSRILCLSKDEFRENNIFVFQSMVLDECTRLVADSSEKSSVKIEELNSEIRKLKAMIGKNDINSLMVLIYY